MPFNGFMNEEVKETVWSIDISVCVMLYCCNKQPTSFNNGLQCFTIMIYLNNLFFVPAIYPKL